MNAIGRPFGLLLIKHDDSLREVWLLPSHGIQAWPRTFFVNGHSERPVRLAEKPSDYREPPTIYGSLEAIKKWATGELHMLIEDGDQHLPDVGLPVILTSEPDTAVAFQKITMDWNDVPLYWHGHFQMRSWYALMFGTFFPISNDSSISCTPLMHYRAALKAHLIANDCVPFLSETGVAGFFRLGESLEEGRKSAILYLVDAVAGSTSGESLFSMDENSFDHSFGSFRCELGTVVTTEPPLILAVD